MNIYMKNILMLFHYLVSLPRLASEAKRKPSTKYLENLLTLCISATFSAAQ